MGVSPLIDHVKILQEERVRYDAMPPGAERAWTITNSACLRFRQLGEDAGMYQKTMGTQWNGQATDLICYHDTGAGYDCLFDGDGMATPQFNYVGVLDVSRWMEPIGSAPPPVDPPPVDPPPVDPPPTEPPVCPCQEELEQIRVQLNAILAVQAGIEELLTQGLWEAKLSHRLLGSMSGTVGPLRQTT